MSNMILELLANPELDAEYRAQLHLSEAIEAMLPALGERAYDWAARQLAAASRNEFPERVRRPIPPGVRKRVMERDAYRCQLCRSWADLQVDHIIPRSRGGTDDESNLQVLCGSCNRSKGASL